MRFSVFSLQFLVVVLLSTLTHAEEDRKNWLNGGDLPGSGRFEMTEPVPNPWGGIDAEGYLRKSVAMPTANPFVTKSNQFSYAWLGSSVSFVDMDGDGLPDLVSPDGNGVFWFWKNTGTAGKPEFGRGESMPLLIDDLRSEFKPIFGTSGKPPPQKEDLTSSQLAAKRRVDEKRERELEKLLKKNERLPKDKQAKKKDLEKQVEEEFPYDADKPAAPTPSPTPENRFSATAPIPPGGLTCVLNTFRRLRLISAPADWNGDGTPDLIAGDSGGTVYSAKNTGRPGFPAFGYVTRLADALPLKVVRLPAAAGKAPVFQPVEFMNYAMPFVCDWDGNRIPDLLVGEGTYSVNSIRLFPDAARATPQNPPKEEFLYIGEDRTFLAPFAWDWDGDGDLDLFVCDDKGRLTVHRRSGSPAGIAPPVTSPGAPVPQSFHPIGAAGSGTQLDPPQNMTLEGGNEALAYCTPQPCDWNADGIMDIVWGEPFGRILVATGREKGGLAFSGPEAIRSVEPPGMLQFPAGQRNRRTISLAAVPARVKDEFGGERDGGTASAESYYRADGTSRENTGGWPENNNKALYGLVPSWPAVPPPPIDDQFDDDRAGKTGKKQGSWGIAPLPGDIWEVVDESSAPGQGKTLLLRWHDTSRNAAFKTQPPAPPQWTRGAAIHFDKAGSGPFGSSFTKQPITIKFHMKLDGEFSRLDVQWRTCWGPLGPDGKPPAEGGSFSASMTTLPRGQWFEFSHTEPPHKTYERGLDGALSIELLGKGEVRVRDVRVFEGN